MFDFLKKLFKPKTTKPKAKPKTKKIKRRGGVKVISNLNDPTNIEFSKPQELPRELFQASSKEREIPELSKDASTIEKRLHRLRYDLPQSVDTIPKTIQVQKKQISSDKPLPEGWTKETNDYGSYYKNKDGIQQRDFPDSVAKSPAIPEQIEKRQLTDPNQKKPILRANRTPNDSLDLKNRINKEAKLPFNFGDQYSKQILDARKIVDSKILRQNRPLQKQYRPPQDFYKPQQVRQYIPPQNLYRPPQDFYRAQQVRQYRPPQDIYRAQAYAQARPQARQPQPYAQARPQQARPVQPKPYAQARPKVEPYRLGLKHRDYDVIVNGVKGINVGGKSKKKATRK